MNHLLNLSEIPEIQDSSKGESFPVMRLKWAGHLARMNEDRCCKKIFLAKPMGNRPRVRTPLKWIYCVEKDLKILKGQKLEKIAKSGDAWRRLLEKARAHRGLSSH
ncbi:hypothetical protein TNCV_962201 [Trichonephila clavipes]|nr:hypothetical protein TNCV_962201 [Trichonephila clavipes]